jgi:PEP-CTERM motif
MRIAALTLICLALAAVPAWADYSNGAINGTTDAWTINFGYVVSDSYVSDGNVTGFMFGVWEFPGDTMTTVDWSITSGENSGTVFGSGTANVTDKYISSNQYGYNIDLITVSGLNVAEISGNTYWLNLQNASVPSGDPVYWDENSGKSSASESALGTIPSEAFTINSSGSTSGSTPEPSSIMLFGSGILGLAGVLRRKLF